MRFEVQAEPRPQPRPRFARGRAYEPATIKAFKAAVRSAAQAAMSGRPPSSTAVTVTLKFRRKFETTSRRFGDADNLAKAVLDALAGVVFTDDSQITRLLVEKEKSPVPSVIVTVGDNERNEDL